MSDSLNKYGEISISLILLLLNVGCVLLFHLIGISAGGSEFERTALSFAFQYLTWAVLVIFLIVLVSFKKLNGARVISIVLTLLNIFAVVGGLVCNLPFRL